MVRFKFVSIQYYFNEHILLFILLVSSSPPLDVQVMTAGPTSLNVTWKPPREIDINGILTNYTIEYYIIDEESSSRNSSIIPSTVFNLLLESLDNFTTYNVSVLASTLVGRGPSNERTQTTAENGELSLFVLCLPSA